MVTLVPCFQEPSFCSREDVVQIVPGGGTLVNKVEAVFRRIWKGQFCWHVPAQQLFWTLHSSPCSFSFGFVVIKVDADVPGLSGLFDEMIQTIFLFSSISNLMLMGLCSSQSRILQQINLASASPKEKMGKLYISRVIWVKQIVQIYFVTSSWYCAAPFVQCNIQACITKSCTKLRFCFSFSDLYLKQSLIPFKDLVALHCVIAWLLLVSLRKPLGLFRTPYSSSVKLGKRCDNAAFELFGTHRGLICE